MKDYKTVGHSTSGKYSLEELLNKYATEGWSLKEAHPDPKEDDFTLLILEREAQSKL